MSKHLLMSEVPFSLAIFRPSRIEFNGQINTYWTEPTLAKLMSTTSTVSIHLHTLTTLTDQKTCIDQYNWLRTYKSANQNRKPINNLRGKLFHNQNSLVWTLKSESYKKTEDFHGSLISNFYNLPQSHSFVHAHMIKDVPYRIFTDHIAD